MPFFDFQSLLLKIINNCMYNSPGHIKGESLNGKNYLCPW